MGNNTIWRREKSPWIASGCCGSSASNEVESRLKSGLGDHARRAGGVLAAASQPATGKHFIWTSRPNYLDNLPHLDNFAHVRFRSPHQNMVSITTHEPPGREVMSIQVYKGTIHRFRCGQGQFVHFWGLCNLTLVSLEYLVNPARPPRPPRQSRGRGSYVRLYLLL